MSPPSNPFVSAVVQSEHRPGVSYRITQLLGEGGTCFAFLAIQSVGDTRSLVVLKLVRPDFQQRAPDDARRVIMKEATALGRLSERTPATPFVVRVFDWGETTIPMGGATITLPWVVVEYVHGGVEGSTIEERIERSITTTAHGFNPARASNAIDHMARGLDAVHRCNVIHRDFTPRNVLVTGSGWDELFKVSDFGIARSAGEAETFGASVLGTPGYAPPELLDFTLPPDARRVGPWTDVWSFACVVYALLTGEDYFPCEGLTEAVKLARSPERRSVLDARGLHPIIAARKDACVEIDRLLTAATRREVVARPSLEALAAKLVRALPSESLYTSSASRVRTFAAGTASWTWLTLSPGSDERVIREVAWDTDSQCVAATSTGLASWNGVAWVSADHPEMAGRAVRFVVRAAAGTWVVGGDRGMLASYASGAWSAVTPPSAEASLIRFAGDADDLGVALETRRGGGALHAHVGRRWLRPVEVGGAATLTGLARIDDATFLVVGRGESGQGYCARFHPLELRLERLPVQVDPLLACAARADRQLGIAVSATGEAVVVDGNSCHVERIAPGTILSTATVDVMGRAWAAAAGEIWMRDPSTASWQRVWNEKAFQVPFVSLFADAGTVLAVAANGAIVRGSLVERALDRTIDMPDGTVFAGPMGRLDE